ncbi:cellulase family glycosylhydrolase [Geodermatophilus sp. TF02-6]|uniref:cellulase family glycosylhydrolase n=1 Tax=Geodermatophilus sp. TF02-6 TaxID=2250575 RepID=UPI0013140474|nr:cellulase family glycosylhydrolase [Geodermatophilus sp. TF02-6]
MALRVRSPGARRWLVVAVVAGLLAVTVAWYVAWYTAGRVDRTPRPDDGVVVSPTFFGMHTSSVSLQAWPTASFATLRVWGQYPSVTWAALNPAPGVYDWADLDTVVAEAARRGIDVVYTFGDTPGWASTDPLGTGCAYGAGSCYAPTEASWRAFVTAITTRYAGLVRYWELWNEPNAENFWSGTTRHMVEMARTAYPIIKGADPRNVVLSPSPQGTHAHRWLDAYLGSGGVTVTDVVAFHGYLPAEPEALVPLVDDIRGVLARHPHLAGRPLWDTEHSWGTASSPFGVTQDLQSAWLARHLVLSASSGIARSFWYLWDGYDGQPQWGMLFNATTQQLQEPGVAYQQVHDWLTGATLHPCVAHRGVYQCQLTRSGGYRGLVVWAATDDPSRVTSWDVPEPYTTYRTVEGTTRAIDAGRSVDVTMTPVLLQGPGAPVLPRDS